MHNLQRREDDYKNRCYHKKGSGYDEYVFIYDIKYDGYENYALTINIDIEKSAHKDIVSIESGNIYFSPNMTLFKEMLKYDEIEKDVFFNIFHKEKENITNLFTKNILNE